MVTVALFSFILTSDHIRYFSFFTIWGLLFTTFAMIAGVFVNDKDTFSNENLAESDMNYRKRRAKCCRAWKLYTVLYEIAFICEIVIVPYFWLALFHGKCVRSRVVIEGWPIECWPTVLDHSIPLSCLLLSQFVNV